MSITKAIKTFPWGGEIYKEFPIYTKSANKFYARHGKTAEGRNYIEFSKFGPKPNTEGESYFQKLRLYSPQHWLQIKRSVEGELAKSIGWDLAAAEKDLDNQLAEKSQKTEETNK